jgi:transcriptional regulator with XRE-family HTH domain
MTTRKFSEMLQDWPIKGRQDPKHAERSVARLDKLRKSRSVTQAEVAEHLRTNQGGISRIERRTDIYISTLSQYVRALGGKLEIRAIFPDSEVRITQFEDGNNILG